METYEITATVTQQVTVKVTAENINAAEKQGIEQINAGEADHVEILHIDEDVIAEKANATKAPNVCVACEG